MQRLFALFTSIALAITASAAPSLNIGDPAPPIKSAKWIKGTAEEKLDPSLVYVVEFWATWCGPCKKNIPHLTELAAKYKGKVRIIGIDIWENEKDPEKRLSLVTKFVESMGDTMNYSVATDDNEGSIAKGWMDAAGENGIPCAFVIGKDGNIAWFGFPTNLDKILEQTVNGTLDTAAFKRDLDQRRKVQEEKDRVVTLYKPVNELAEAGKHAEAVAALDKLVAEHPELAAKSNFKRYNLLHAYDQPAAWQLVRKMLEGELKDNSSALHKIGRDLTNPPGPKTPDWDLAIAVAQRANELSKNSNPNDLYMLSVAYGGKGEFAKAVEVGDLAVKLAKEDSSLPKSTIGYFERRVSGFRKQLEKQNQK